MCFAHDVAFGNDVCLRAHKGKHYIIVSDSEQHHFGKADTSLGGNAAYIVLLFKKTPLRYEQSEHKNPR